MAVYGGFEGALKIGTTDAATMRATNVIEWQSLDIDVKNALKRIFHGGSRSVEETKEGLQEASLKISRIFRDKTTLSDKAVSTGTLTTYFIGVYPQGYQTGYVEYLIEGKFDTWKLSMKLDDVASEESDFIIKTITPGEVPA